MQELNQLTIIPMVKLTTFVPSSKSYKDVLTEID